MHVEVPVSVVQHDPLKAPLCVPLNRSLKIVLCSAAQRVNYVFALAG